MLHHAGLQPLLDETDDPFVPDPVLDELHQPFVRKGIEKGTYVGVEHPIDVFSLDSVKRQAIFAPHDS